MVIPYVRQNSLTGSNEVAIAIAVRGCPPTGCIDPAEAMGILLYDGPYNPQYPTNHAPQDVPQQNFTVNLPDALQRGQQALISVAHFSLYGVSPFLLVSWIHTDTDLAGKRRSFVRDQERYRQRELISDRHISIIGH